MTRTRVLLLVAACCLIGLTAVCGSVLANEGEEELTSPDQSFVTVTEYVEELPEATNLVEVETFHSVRRRGGGGGHRSWSPPARHWSPPPARHWSPPRHHHHHHHRAHHHHGGHRHHHHHVRHHHHRHWGGHRHHHHGRHHHHRHHHHRHHHGRRHHRHHHHRHHHRRHHRHHRRGHGHRHHHKRHRHHRKHRAEKKKDPAQYSGFVNSLYRQYLCRDGEPGGMAGWTGALASGALTEAQVVAGFINSAEYKARGGRGCGGGGGGGAPPAAKPFNWGLKNFFANAPAPKPAEVAAAVAQAAAVAAPAPAAPVAGAPAAAAPAAAAQTVVVEETVPLVVDGKVVPGKTMVRRRTVRREAAPAVAGQQAAPAAPVDAQAAPAAAVDSPALPAAAPAPASAPAPCTSNSELLNQKRIQAELLRQQNEALRAKLAAAATPATSPDVEKAKWEALERLRKLQLEADARQTAREDAERELRRKRNRAEFALKYGSESEKKAAKAEIQDIAQTVAQKKVEVSDTLAYLAGGAPLPAEKPGKFENGFWVGPFAGKHTNNEVERKLCPDCEPIIYNADSPLSDDDIKLMRAQHAAVVTDDVKLHSQLVLDKATLTVDDANAFKAKLLARYPAHQNAADSGFDEGGEVEA